MLKNLFGTTARYLILRVLVFNPDHPYTIAELRRKLHTSDATLRSELQRLVAMQLVAEATGESGKTFHFLKDSSIFPELRALFLKAQLLMEYDFGKKIMGIGRIAYAALTGYFTNVPEAKTDIFIVGTVNRTKLRRLVRRFQHDMDHDVRYTVLSKKEYQYRNDITDRFLYDILENRKIVLVDKLHS